MVYWWHILDMPIEEKGTSFHESRTSGWSLCHYGLLPKWRHRNQNGGSHENFAGGKFYIVHLKKKIQVNKKQKKTNKFTDFFKIKHSSISQSCIASFISLSLLNSLFFRSLAAKRDVLKRTPRTLMIPINQRSPRAQVDPKTKRYSVLHKDQNPRHISQLWNRM